MKKLTNLFLGLGLVIGLAACGSTDSSTSPASSASSKSEVESSKASESTSSSSSSISSSSSSSSSSISSSSSSVMELKKATLYAVGDSTLAAFNDDYYYPRYGYATMLGNYFKTELTINNLALSGRSSKSFTSEANYETLKTSLKAGDYLLIGFGHNDEKSDDADRFTDASLDYTNPNSFGYSLNESYIKLAKEKGATPILCTPVVRVDTNNDYSGASGHITSIGDYADAIVKLGKETSTEVVNLTKITKEHYQELGFNEAMLYHAMISGKMDQGSLTYDSSSLDKTHLNIYGAKYVAYEVANTLKSSTCSIKDYVKDDIVMPTKADLVANPNYVLPSYQAPNLNGYEAPAQFKTITEGWYGTAFGDCGGTPNVSSNGYYATETASGIFKVGNDKSKGKLTSTNDGFAYAFRQVEKNKNFTISADVLVLQMAATKQAGFGLMLRDDVYINQEGKSITNTANYLAAGFITNDGSCNVLFKRENKTLAKEANLINGYYAKDDTAKLEIVSLGQSITIKVIYKDNTYTKTTLDFDLFATDSNYMYVGMFATRGTVCEFSNVSFTITGESQGA